jgi:CRISPR-associated endonuclease Csn1
MSTIWSFDLGKASIGEAVRDTKTNEFLHKASLLIPAEFASTKDAAARRRAWRTRQAHKAREAWLDEVWRAAKIPEMPEPLRKRTVGKNEVTKKWELKHSADERLEREFPAKGDTTCYTSCLLRIRLLRGDTLEPWQIYKALHSAIQKRGYGRVPWAAREAKRGAKSEEEIVSALLKKDESKLGEEEKVDRRAVEAWRKFKQDVRDADFHFPCYYDARAMKLWSPAEPSVLREHIECNAGSTRKVRFDRADVEKEIAMLANRAVELLPALREVFARWQREGCTVEWREQPLRPSLRFGKMKPNKRAKAFDVTAKDFGAFLVHGPAGEPPEGAREDFTGYLAFRTEHGVHPGSTDDWLGATGQKTPRFDNRIINACALLPPDRFQVCKAEPQLNLKTGQPYPESLLHCEAVCLMKLKNLRVTKDGEQRKLLPKELRAIFEKLRADALAVKMDAKDWAQKVADRFAIVEKEWGNKKAFGHLGLRPLAGQEEVKAPNVGGRSRYSRPALRLIRALVLSGREPSVFKARLHGKEPELLGELGLDFRDSPLPPRAKVNGKPEPQRRAYVLPGDLKFLDDLIRTGDTWDKLHFPEQRLDALEAQHTDDEGQLDRDAAISAVLGAINDPVVRHRLGVFARRLKALQFGTKQSPAFGVPERIVLEFVRTDFMGDEAELKLRRFQDEREKARKEAREQTLKLGLDGRSAGLRYQLWKAQGCICLYTGKPLMETELANYEIDHIVPRSLGGPDAQVNYVLTFHDINNTKEKGALTPYALLHGKEGWDCYEKRVKSHSTTLRNKKVQLLLREDAPELVERYTALAETAWISRLAQKVASLHFGWRNGIDYGGKETKQRVVVISGGLTARLRRRYHLDSLLGNDRSLDEAVTELLKEQAALRDELAKMPIPMPDTHPPYARLKEIKARLRELRDTLDEKSREAEKQRGDKRHHALDAMVLSFVQQKAADFQWEEELRLAEIGDAPPYPPSAENQVKRHHQDIWIRQERAKEAKTQEERERLHREITGLHDELRKLRQPPNVIAVRKAFRRAIYGEKPDGSDAILPRALHFEKPKMQATFHRGVWLPVESDAKVAKATHENFNQAYYEDRIPLERLPWLDDGTPSARFCREHALRRAMWIAPHKDYAEKEIRRVLVAALHPGITPEEWQAWCRSDAVFSDEHEDGLFPAALEAELFAHGIGFAGREPQGAGNPARGR